MFFEIVLVVESACILAETMEPEVTNLVAAKFQRLFLPRMWNLDVRYEAR